MLLQRRRFERPLAILAHRQDDRDGVGDQPLGRKQQRVVGRGVEPVGIVHQDQERLGLRGGGDQAQRRGADGEPVVGLGLAEPERALERLCLLRRDLAEMVEQRPHQFEQAGELQLRLVLHADGADNCHSLGAFGGVVEQSRFAHTRLTPKYERPATPSASAIEQIVDARAVGFPTHEHGFTVVTRAESRHD